MMKMLTKFLFIAIVMSCDSHVSKNHEIKIRVIDHKTKKAEKNVLVEMEKINKPIFRMWHYEKIEESYTNSNGEVSFKIMNRKDYRFIAKDEKLRNYGYIELSNLENSDDDIFILELKKTNIKKNSSDF